MLNSRTVMDDTIVYYRGKNQKRMELICIFFFSFFFFESGGSKSKSC